MRVINHRCPMDSISFVIPNFESPPPSPSMEVLAEVFSNLPGFWSLRHHPHWFVQWTSPGKSLRNSLWTPPGGKDNGSPVRDHSPTQPSSQSPSRSHAPSPAPLSKDEHEQLGKRASQMSAKACARDNKIRQIAKTLPLPLLDVQWAEVLEWLEEKTPSTGPRPFKQAATVFLPRFGIATNQYPNWVAYSGKFQGVVDTKLKQS